jgi:hypothetical protein
MVVNGYRQDVEATRRALTWPLDDARHALKPVLDLWFQAWQGGLSEDEYGQVDQIKRDIIHMIDEVNDILWDRIAIEPEFVTDDTWQAAWHLMGVR